MTYITGHIRYFALYLIVAMFFACQQPGGDSTGSEYMPDMGHSIAYEANYYNYYYYNTWGTEHEYYEMNQPRLPVNGTIPRGYAGGAQISDNQGFAISPNGAVPYYYGDSDEERLRATAEIIKNPYHITDSGLAVGKELYDVYCGICHGEKGDGLGFLVRDGSPYPVQPANLLLPEFIDDSNGRYYHAIMYGKNLMSDYKDKLSYEERWQVIHYIRALQAKELKLEYSQLVNTLNGIDEPAGVLHEAVAGMEGHDDDMGGHSHTDGTEHEEGHEDDHDNDDHNHSEEEHH